jgi:hypothetical protein
MADKVCHSTVHICPTHSGWVSASISSNALQYADQSIQKVGLLKNRNDTNRKWTIFLSCESLYKWLDPLGFGRVPCFMLAGVSLAWLSPTLSRLNCDTGEDPNQSIAEIRGKHPHNNVLTIDTVQITIASHRSFNPFSLITLNCIPLELQTSWWMCNWITDAHPHKDIEMSPSSIPEVLHCAWCSE